MRGDTIDGDVLLCALVEIEDIQCLVPVGLERVTF